MISEQETLEFCNKVREAGGGVILDDLLPGIPSVSQECLIAQNLNFDCEVLPVGAGDDYDRWQMHISGFLDNPDWKEIARNISEKMDMPIEHTTDRKISLKLPPELAKVAHEFDRVWAEYEDLYTYYLDEVEYAEGEYAEIEKVDNDAEIERSLKKLRDYEDNLEHPWLLKLSSSYAQSLENIPN